MLVLYRPNSEYATMVETYARDFQRQYDAKLELVSVNTRDGAALASLYDIMSYPSIMAIADNGSVLNSWIGPQFPLMDELAVYTRA